MDPTSRPSDPRDPAPGRRVRSAAPARLVALLALTLCVGVAAGPAVALAPDQIDALASDGRFDELADRLTPVAGSAQPDVDALMAKLAIHEANEQRRDDARRDAYDESVAEVARNLAQQNTEDAMVAAIEAHGLATDRAAFENEHTVVEALNRTTQEAAAAEAAGEWVRASNLYRLLDLFYEDEKRYENQLDEANRNLRILQLYAPEHLQSLYDTEARRRAEVKGEEAPEPATLELEPWQERLEGVNQTILRSTLSQAHRRHIDKTDDDRAFRRMLGAGLDNLRAVVESEPLAQTFEGLNNQGDRIGFLAELQQIARQLNDPGQKLDHLAAFTTIDRVITANAQSVKLPEEVVIFELTEGATSSLDDFSSVIWPADIPAFLRTTQGRFTGIGVQISKRQGELIVVSPLEDTPAHRAGLKADDVIATVDGVSTANWSLTKAVDRITGDAGTDVNLEIKRRGQPQLIAYTITRAPIPIESVRGWRHLDEGGWDYFVDPASRIGYVRVSAFLPQTVDDLDAAVAQMQETGPINGLIIDLRFNPGGLYSAAVDIADRFLSTGSIVSTVNGDGKRTKQDSAKRHTTYRQFPVVALINQGSASASEIVAGALQDWDRGVVVGNNSFGKGSVQDLYPLARGSAYLKLTTQYYQLPSGKIIHRTDDAEQWGIAPDLAVEMTDQQVRDAIEFRQLIDVVREPGEVILADIEKPWADERFRKPNGLREVQGERPDGSDLEMVEIRKPVPEEIFELGLDAQLEAAVLVLEAKRVADALKAAPARVADGDQPGAVSAN
ncbi:MAG: S41 family peptidase [Planctomycetota bacterium]